MTVRLFAGAMAVLMIMAMTAPGISAMAPLEKTTITVGTVTNSWNEWLPQWVAISKGWFAREGLTVRQAYISPAPPLMAALVSGSVDIAIDLANDTVFRAIDSGANVRLIGGYFEEHNYGLYVRSGITKPADLRGKKIAYDQPSGPIDVMTREVLTHYGLDPSKDVSMIPVGNAPQRTAALLGGSVSAAVSSLTDGPILADHGIRLLLRFSSIYPQYSFGSIAAAESTLTKYPRTIAAFLRAEVRGMRYVRTAPAAELKEIVKAQGGSVRDQYFTRELPIEFESLTKDGSLNLQGLATVQKREQAAGRLPASFDYRKIVDLRFIQQAWAGLGITQVQFSDNLPTK